MGRTATLLALLLCWPAWADPNISVPAEVKGDPAAFIQVPATTKGVTVRWVTLDSGLNLFPVELLKDTRTAVVSAVAPGRYRLLAYTAVGTEPSEAVVCTVIVGQPKPPEPGPTPDPQPTPHPAPSKAWLILIEETAQATAARGLYLTDPALRDYLKAKGWATRLADQDARDAQGKPPADLAPWIAKAKAGQLPALFVVGADGFQHYGGPVPSTPADLLALLKRIGGD